MKYLISVVLIVLALALGALWLTPASQKLGGTTNFNDLAVDTLTIGSGSSISKFLTGTATWNPGSVGTSTPANSATSTSVTVTGAVAGNSCVGSLTSATTTLVVVSCSVTAADTASVSLQNLTGSALDLATGTVRASVIQN